MGDQMNQLEESMSKLSSSDEQQSKANILSITKTLESKLKALDEVKYIGYRMNQLEESMSKLTNEILGKESQMEEKILDGFKDIRERMFRLEDMISTKKRYSSNEPLRFHSLFHGKNIRFSRDYQTAARTNPQETDVYGGVVSQRPLCDEEVFQFRIDETVDKWKEFGIAIGVMSDPVLEIQTSGSISYNQNITGTWGIHSWSDSSSGTSNTFKDGSLQRKSFCPVDTRHLSVGTIFGVSRHSNGNVHFYLNGDIYPFVAFKKVPKDIYAFIDILNYVSKISIVD